MGPEKRKVAQGNASSSGLMPETLHWMRGLLECPVCLEDMKDPPIFQCENQQGHSLCSKCHTSLRNEKKPCPVCREPLNNRRNLSLEHMVEKLPNKITCKFDGCDFKRSNREAVEKHEEGECENRLVPCAFCNEKVEMKGLVKHLIGKHERSQCFVEGVGGHCTVPLQCAPQVVLKRTDVDEQCPEFLFNWDKKDMGGVKSFWISHIGPKNSAKNFKYTFRVRKDKHSEECLLESTRRCVPCDLSHEEVKNLQCAITLDRELVEDAKQRKDDKDVIYYDLIIHDKP